MPTETRCSDSARNPAIGLIEGTGSYDQVENRVLDPCARQFPLRQPSGEALGGAVNYDTRDGPVVRRVTIRRDGDVDLRRWLVREAVDFGGGFMAEHRAWPGTPQGSPEPGLAVHGAGEGRVHAPLDSPPLSRFQAVGHCPSGVTSSQRLGTVGDAALRI
jgi:hypothetical protein